MAVPRDALAAAHQAESAFQVQTSGRCIVLQDRGLQRPVTGRFGLLAECGEQGQEGYGSCKLKACKAGWCTV